LNVTHPIPPVRFRRRLTVAFVLVAAISAGVIAIVSFILVRADRYRSFHERAASSSALALSLAGGADRNDDRVTTPEEVVAHLGSRESFEIVAISDDQAVSSTADINEEQLPARLEVSSEDPAFLLRRTEIDGHPYLVMRPREELDGVSLNVLFSAAALERQMDRLGSIMLRTWLGVVLLAGLVGMIVARRALRPVARASEAARSLAEGLLETRLPVDRQDEFGAWAISFNEMADALQTKIEALLRARARERRFASDVAHELRTPVTSLVASASLLRTKLGELDPDTLWSARRLLEQVTRMKSLVLELLEMSRFDEGRERLELVKVDPQEFLKSLLAQRGWTKQVECLVEAPPVTTDARRLERILGNLIDNAILHGGGEVSLVWSAVDGWTTIKVGDRGPGIAAGDLERVFDRFFKADPSRSGGSGLGLSIARENALILDGDISVQDRRPSGTEFVVKLPMELGVTESLRHRDIDEVLRSHSEGQAKPEAPRDPRL
jgi:signal transduction histidine kinase